MVIGDQSMFLNRRRFLASAAGSMTAPLVWRAALGNDNQSVAVPAVGRDPKPAAEEVVTVDVANGDELQRALNRHAGTGHCVRLEKPGPLTCGVREEVVGSEKSIH